MEGKTVAIIGATGLIGSELLNLLLKDDDFGRIKLLVRRPFVLDHAKVRVFEIDFADKAAFENAIAGSDAVFCTVGTTNKQVGGDKQAYRNVDFDIPVNAARCCVKTGCPCILIVTAVGADSKSNNFYLRLKGETEDALKAMNISSVSVFHPSMLLGKRLEFRRGERTIQALMKGLSFLLPSKYKPITARRVAEAMIAASKQRIPGFHVLHYKEMQLKNTARARIE